LDGIEFTRENWVRFAKFGLGRRARSINDTAFGLFLQWTGRFTVFFWSAFEGARLVCQRSHR
jgi:hypothetical protein